MWNPFTDPWSEKLKSFVYVVFMIALIEVIAESITMTCVLPFFGSCLVDIKSNVLDAIFLIAFTTPLIIYFVVRPYILAKQDLIEKLEHISGHDELTDLYNRRAFMKKLR